MNKTPALLLAIALLATAAQAAEDSPRWLQFRLNSRPENFATFSLPAGQLLTLQSVSTLRQQTVYIQATNGFNANGRPFVVSMLLGDTILGPASIGLELVSDASEPAAIVLFKIQSAGGQQLLTLQRSPDLTNWTDGGTVRVDSTNGFWRLKVAP